MNSNASEYKSVIGLDDLYAAKVTKDDTTGFTCDTPFYLAPAASISQQPTVSDDTQYADNQPYDTIHSEGDTKNDLTVTGLSAEAAAALFGDVFDAASGRVWENGGTPDYYALGFRSKKSNGSYRYYWFLKGRFSRPKEDADTQADKATPKPLQISYTAIKTVYKFNLGSKTDSVKRVWGDDDTTNFDETNWFAQVQTPSTTSPAALALSSSSPAANATGVVVSVDVTLTFNNALQTGEEKDIHLVTAAGVEVASAISIDTTRKIVTINPNSNMGAATVHIVTYSVKDIYGQTLEGVFKFTTA